MTKGLDLRGQYSHAVFFDLDGVIIDSAPLIIDIIQKMLMDRGFTADSELIKKFVGPPLEESFAILLDSIGEPSNNQNVAEWSKEFRSFYQTRYQETKTYKKIDEMLLEISEKLPCAIATSKSQEFANAILKNLKIDHFFTVVAGTEPHWQDKSKLTVLKNALSSLNVALHTNLTGKNCIMIGDRYHDIEAANALAMVSIGVTWGVGEHEEIINSEPDFIVDKPSSVTKLIPIITQNNNKRRIVNKWQL